MTFQKIQAKTIAKAIKMCEFEFRTAVIKVGVMGWFELRSAFLTLMS